MAIGSIDSSAPATVGQPVGNGAQEIRNLKADIKASFPNFTPGADVVTATAAQLNAAYEPVISPKNTAFNRNFSTTYGGSSNDVARADHNHVYLSCMYKENAVVQANGTVVTTFTDSAPFSGSQPNTTGNITRDLAAGKITIGLWHGYYQVTMSAMVYVNSSSADETTFYIGTSGGDAFSTKVKWSVIAVSDIPSFRQANIFATGVFSHSGVSSRDIQVWATDSGDTSMNVSWKNLQVIVNRLA